MSKKPSVLLRPIENDPLIKEALYVADYMYEKIGEPDFSDDERWRLARELKDASVFMVSDVSMAVGNDGLANVEFMWGNARKQLSRLRTIYHFADRQGFLKIDPSIMVRIDKLIAQVGEQIEQSYDRSEAALDRELNGWVKKHKLWKEMSDES